MIQLVLRKNCFQKHLASFGDCAKGKVTKRRIWLEDDQVERQASMSNRQSKKKVIMSPGVFVSWWLWLWLWWFHAVLFIYQSNHQTHPTVGSIRVEGKHNPKASNQSEHYFCHDHGGRLQGEDRRYQLVPLYLCLLSSFATLKTISSVPYFVVKVVAMPTMLTQLVAGLGKRVIIGT